MISVVGAGPAGTSAALAALQAGAEVTMFDPSPFPRHKVCGEFLSPEIAALVPGLPDCARILRVTLQFERARKTWALEEPAYGLSRHSLDKLLLDRALAAGARLCRERLGLPPKPAVIAHGRKTVASAGNRLFGFKAHFSGPSDDGLNLYFFEGCYVGVNGVEGGITNVCGLAPEGILKRLSFDIDALTDRCAALRERLDPLRRAWEWLKTGPLVYGGRWEEAEPEIYRAGDALGFVDPFTGSGLLSAVMTGRSAGDAGARGLPAGQHLKRCQELLRNQYRAAALFRAAIAYGVADWILPLLPGTGLFHLTRPRVRWK